MLLQPGHTSCWCRRRVNIAMSSWNSCGSAFYMCGAALDHLLFIAGLIFIARTPRRVLATVTGFTIAHSITLALAALDPATAGAGDRRVIALSIILLAVEIAKGPRDTLTWRHPIAIASSFGLLHGLGFAAVLHDVGLPQQGLVTALLAFNLGIEAGQVLFAVPVLLIFALARSLQRAGGRPPSACSGWPATPWVCSPATGCSCGCFA